MIRNPSRAVQGGDVEGSTKIDVTLGEACEVATASFDPGYDITASMPLTKKADLVQGYCTYGRAIGEDAFEDWDEV